MVPYGVLSADAQRRHEHMVALSQTQYNRCCQHKAYQIRVAGPSMSGKTTFVKWLKHRQFIPPDHDEKRETDYQAIEAERVDYMNDKFVFWLTKHHADDPVRQYVPELKAIVFIFDASDRGRMKIAARCLDSVLSDLPNVEILMILATKMDKSGAMDLEAIKEHLNMTAVIEREFGIFVVSSLTGMGVDEAMRWLRRRLHERDPVWESLYYGIIQCSSCFRMCCTPHRTLS